jgi:hypothetical protein
MEISFKVPLQRAWDRARRMLFTPFALERWVALGFAAFLSEWLTGGAGHGGGRWRTGDHWAGREALDRVSGVLHDPVWLPLIIGIVVLVVAILLVFQYIGSRGKFVFLDDVVCERHLIGQPWREYAAQGNSLFLWRVGLWLVTAALALAVTLPILGLVFEAIRQERLALLLVGPAIIGMAALGGIGILAAVAVLLLDEFVVPIMYRHRVSATEAWRRFLPLLGGRWPVFLLYALLQLVLHIALVGVLAAFGLATCCVGLLLLVVPYVGQVVLLPVHVFFRALGPEFLRQFGSDFDAFGGPGAVA